MHSTITKFLKTTISVAVAFLCFTTIILLAFYFYLSDGVEFKLDKSNQTLNSLTKRFELDFKETSSIYFKAREENIDAYIILEDVIIKRSGNILINSKLCLLPTSKSLKSWAGVILTAPLPCSGSA